MKLPAIMLLAITAALAYTATVAAGPTVTATQDDDGVTVSVDGELFTRYLIRSGTRPVLWPIIGPNGQPMTRSYPIGEAQEGESRDHVHHRSMWIGYEGFNETDTWTEPGSGGKVYPKGSEVHQEFVRVESEGSAAVIVTRNQWRNAEGEPICQDLRTMRFGADDDSDSRWIDYQIDIEASAGPLRIADSKEGFFALRVASSMKVDAGGGGEFVLSNGLRNDPAWGKSAAWIDYHGPVGGETMGIAILSHPSSYRPEPRWHVRPYGLLSANPFGELAFTGDRRRVTNRPLRATIPAGDSITFRYLVIFHRGDEKEADIAGRFAKFAASQ